MRHNTEEFRKEGKNNEDFETVWNHIRCLLDQYRDRALSAVFISGKCNWDDTAFVPAGVSIINYFDVLKSSIIPLIVICVVSTVITFAATAYSVTLTVRLLEKRKGGKKK